MRIVPARAHHRKAGSAPPTPPPTSKATPAAVQCRAKTTSKSSQTALGSLAHRSSQTGPDVMARRLQDRCAELEKHKVALEAALGRLEAAREHDVVRSSGVSGVLGGVLLVELFPVMLQGSWKRSISHLHRQHWKQPSTLHLQQHSGRRAPRSGWRQSGSDAHAWLQSWPNTRRQLQRYGRCA